MVATVKVNPVRPAQGRTSQDGKREEVNVGSEGFPAMGSGIGSGPRSRRDRDPERVVTSPSST